MFIFLFTFCAISCRYIVKQWLLLLLQEGHGGQPQPGPSHRPDIPQELQYNIRKKSERTYAKNASDVYIGFMDNTKTCLKI